MRSPELPGGWAPCSALRLTARGGVPEAAHSTIMQGPSRAMPDSPPPIRVAIPEGPLALTPAAAYALLRLLRTAADQWVDERAAVVQGEFGHAGCDEEQRRAA